MRTEDGGGEATDTSRDQASDEASGADFVPAQHGIEIQPEVLGCVSTESRSDLGLEPYYQGQGVEEVSPTALWSEHPRCQLRSGQEILDTAASTVVLARPSADTTARPVLVTFVEAVDRQMGGLTVILGLAIVDLDSGETVTCLELDEPAAFGSLFAFGDGGSVLVGVNSVRDGEYSQYVLDVADRSLTAFAQPQPTVRDATVFYTWYEHAVLATADSLVDIDLRTGASHVRTLEQRPSTILRTPWGGLYVWRGTRSTTISLLDDCGTERRQLFVDGRLARFIFTEWGLLARLSAKGESSLVAFDSDLNKRFAVADVTDSVETARGTVYALQRLDGSRWRVIEIDSSGSWVPVLNFESDTVNLQSWLVSGAGESIVFGGVVPGGETGPASLRVFVARDGQLRAIDLAGPTGFHTLGRPERPLLTPDGILVVSQWGRLFGVDTGIAGLSESSFPRGHLGGNESRGPVDAGLTQQLLP